MPHVLAGAVCVCGGDCSVMSPLSIRVNIWGSRRTPFDSLPQISLSWVEMKSFWSNVWESPLVLLSQLQV